MVSKVKIIFVTLLHLISINAQAQKYGNTIYWNRGLISKTPDDLHDQGHSKTELKLQKNIDNYNQASKSETTPTIAHSGLILKHAGSISNFAANKYNQDQDLFMDRRILSEQSFDDKKKYKTAKVNDYLNHIKEKLVSIANVSISYEKLKKNISKGDILNVQCTFGFCGNGRLKEQNKNVSRPEFSHSNPAVSRPLYPDIKIPALQPIDQQQSASLKQEIKHTVHQKYELNSGVKTKKPNYNEGHRGIHESNINITQNLTESKLIPDILLNGTDFSNRQGVVLYESELSNEDTKPSANETAASETPQNELAVAIVQSIISQNKSLAKTDSVELQESNSLLRNIFSSPIVILFGIIFALSAVYITINMEEQHSFDPFQQAQMKPIIFAQRRQNRPRVPFLKTKRKTNRLG